MTLQPLDQISNLRLSNYTRIVEVGDGTSVLINFPHHVSDIVSTTFGASLHGDLDGLPADVAEHAERVGYLTRHSEEAEARWFAARVRDIADRYGDQKKIIFTFVTTNTCNLACSYCFQSSTEMRTLPSRFLTVEQARAGLDMVDAHIASGARINHLELFGGEPLLPSTVRLVETIVEGAVARNLTVRATTNAFYLDRFEHLLGPGRIDNLQITLDGTQEHHDTRRIGTAGKPTFAVILDNIERALRCGVRVEVRANIDQRNVESLPDLVVLLDERGILTHDLASFDHVNVWPDPAAPDATADPDLYLTRSQIDTYLRSRLEEYPVLEGVIDQEPPLARWLTAVMETPHIRFCGAGDSNVFISPESKVYSCNELVGVESSAVGVVEDGAIKRLPLWDKWSDRRIDKLINCRKCSVSFAHGGGCGARLSPDKLGLIGNCGTFQQDFDDTVRRLAAAGSPQ
ncbi:radical SAM protein [Rhodococcus sp. NM-2]|uniref:radical SAM protein n=1 Tax=Rhodococcus sp. NM-2 TaxID=3401174 RepID=UPI003AAD69A9